MASIFDFIRDNWRDAGEYVRETPYVGLMSGPLGYGVAQRPESLLQGAATMDVGLPGQPLPTYSPTSGPSSYSDRYADYMQGLAGGRPVQGPGLGHHGPGDTLEALIEQSRRRNQAEREKRAKARELKKKDYINSWVRDATAGYDGEDGLLAQIKADADDSVSEVHRVNAGLLAPLEESKTEAAKARDEIKAMEAANRKRRDRVSGAETDAASQALGAGFIGSGNQEMDRAADLARATSAGQQAGVDREANLSARDAQAWAGEMQDWAQADAAEASKDIRKSEQRLLAQARRERAQAVAQARREGTMAYDAGEQNRRAEWRDVQRTRAEAANDVADSRMKILMDVFGLATKSVDGPVDFDGDGAFDTDDKGNPVMAPQPTIPNSAIAMLLQMVGGSPELAAALAGQPAGGGSWAGATSNFANAMRG